MAKRINPSKRIKIKMALTEFLLLIKNFYIMDMENFAGATAFFFFISLIPMCMLVAALLPYTGISEDFLIRAVTGYTPNLVDDMVTQIIRDAFLHGGSLVGGSLMVIIVASARGMISLIQGLNVINNFRDDRTSFTKTAVAITYTTLLLGLLVVSLVSMVYGASIKNYILSHLPGLPMPGWLSNLRYLVIVLLASVVFTALYTLLPGPPKEELKKFRRDYILQTPGAVISAVGWAVFSFMYSAAISEGSIYSSYYGSLSAVIIFMVWLYGCFYILLFGGYINYGLQKVLRPLLMKVRSRHPRRRLRSALAEVSVVSAVGKTERKRPQGKRRKKNTGHSRRVKTGRRSGAKRVTAHRRG